MSRGSSVTKLRGRAGTADASVKLKHFLNSLQSALAFNTGLGGGHF